ncbi:MAG: LON peptidase substrate-binding domain-containing protein, partial [Caldilineaceae bacterium]|nr:LON peptidase substrate-binding domain-containing protein [Caldilineaceae bacterium]
MTNQTNSILEVTTLEAISGEEAAIARAALELPAVILYDAILGPHMAAPLEIEDPATQAAVRAAAPEGRLLLLFALPDEIDMPNTIRFPAVTEVVSGEVVDGESVDQDAVDADDIDAEDEAQDRLHHVGVIAQLQSVQRGNGTVIVMQGVMRAEVAEILQAEPYIRARCHPYPDPEEWDAETEELMLEVRGLIEAFVELTPGMPEGIMNFLRSIRTPGHLADNSAYAPEYTYEQRLALLNTFDVMARLRMVRDFFRKRVAHAQVQAKVREQA